MKKQRAWLYCQIALSSSDDFEMGIQVEYLKRFAEQHDYICGGVTREYGGGITLNRPGLEELSKAISDGGVENVIVKDLSRLPRGYQLTCKYIHALGEQGVVVSRVMRKKVCSQNENEVIQLGKRHR